MDLKCKNFKLQDGNTEVRKDDNKNKKRSDEKVKDKNPTSFSRNDDHSLTRMEFMNSVPSTKNENFFNVSLDEHHLANSRKFSFGFPLPYTSGTFPLIAPTAQLPGSAFEDVSSWKWRVAGTTHALPEVLTGSAVDKTCRLPSFMPIFSGLIQRRRRREHRPRRQRTTFSNEQTIKLEMEYGRAEYISRSRRYELAEILSLTENQIKIWFQNRRAKEKRIEKAQLDHQIRNIGLCGMLTHEVPTTLCHSPCNSCNIPTGRVKS